MRIVKSTPVAFLFLLMPAMLGFTQILTAPALAAENSGVEVRNLEMVVSKDFDPFLTVSYIDIMETTGDNIVVDGKFLGYMLTLMPKEPGNDLPGFEITIIMAKSYSSAYDVAKTYIKQMDGFLENGFAWHTISSSIRCDGKYKALAGRGFIAFGKVIADIPIKGISLSQEFYDYVLPGNVDLIVIFKYPTAAQDVELLRQCFEVILSSLVVHSDYFDLEGDTELSPIRHEK